MWVGGVSHDLPKDFEKICIGFLDYFEPQIEEYNNLLTYNKIFFRTYSRCWRDSS
ncbi:MAG: hypothetical protein Ct9H300mP18_06170 [Candidatus Neomarinimicrobiota bacterium]|nr:MAG: hypothetical protein Ct9H300mP18_06170 [Candidatus Neomarinimicrobiota bacterium]